LLWCSTGNPAACCRGACRSQWKRHSASKRGKPEIFNADQGSQFTGAAFTSVLADNGIAISMDGKGAWRANVFERLRRSVKYEEVYLRAYDSASEAHTSIGRYLNFHNRRRPHSSLDGTTPDPTYFTALSIRLAVHPRQTLHLSTRKICSDNRDHLRSRVASNRRHAQARAAKHGPQAIAYAHALPIPVTKGYRIVRDTSIGHRPMHSKLVNSDLVGAREVRQFRGSRRLNCMACPAIITTHDLNA
jgi:hypothetical protein